jgi:hypothetical protein
MKTSRIVFISIAAVIGAGIVTQHLGKRVPGLA